MLKYKRILLKLSGESLKGESSDSFDSHILNRFADEIIPLYNAGVEIAIVIGGGNIFRGVQGFSKGLDRVQGDYMGMLATLINAMAIQSALEEKGIPVEVLSGMEVSPVSEKMSRRRAIESLEQKKIVIIAGGTGNPFFTTDTAAALRAAEIKANVIMKGTRVDGVYSDDPEKNADAVKYDKISFDDAFKKKLKVMDLTAFTICHENNIPIIVFNMNKNKNLENIVLNNKNTGTIIES